MKILRLITTQTMPLVVALVLASEARGDFGPIKLTPGSYNQDLVVEHPPAATTATMDNGPQNTGATFYETGYDTGSGTGLPPAGSTFTSAAAANHSYTMAPSYQTNNAVLIDSTITSGTLTLKTPAAYSGLSFLVASGNGNATVGYTVHHADGTTDAGTFISPDWFNNSPVAFTANGRVDAFSLAFDSVGSGNPRLYPADITVGHPGSPVTSISFSRVSGGHACIFAVSGSTGAPYGPLTVTGYNEDVVVEAASPHLPPAGAYTTATMDSGTANTANSWYAVGFNSAAPTTGLPAAGSALASVSALDHQYLLAPSYATNNVAYVDAGISANMTPVAPATFAALSFLAAAGHGPVLVDYTVYYADGTSETGALTVPDWFNNTPVAFTANGRVDAVTGVLDAVGTGNPRLYSLDIALANPASAVTNVGLVWDPGNATGVAAFFAVSGTGGAVPPVIGAQPLSQNVSAGSPALLSALVSGTPPLLAQWQKLVQGSFINLQDNANLSGSTTTNLTINIASLGDYGAYRLVVTNALGSTASSAATLNVITTRPDVTTPGDPISMYNGSNSPAAEMVPNAIDNTTAKYLNFGIGTGFPPFVGPVGLVVTPSIGSSFVTGLRVYTANDEPERDPADYLLEGSNDGGATFAFIATGSLQLPDDRNALGQPLDPFGEFNQEVGFQNTAYYTTYRLSFLNVKNNLTANSAQVGEIELLGDTPVTLTVQLLSAGQLQLQWPQGTLQEAADLNGPWTTDYAASSPYVVGTTGPRKFFRVVVE